MLNLEQHEPADLASLPLMAIAKNVCLRGVVMGGAEKSVHSRVMLYSSSSRLYLHLRLRLACDRVLILVLTSQLSFHGHLALRIPCQSPPMYR